MTQNFIPSTPNIFTTPEPNQIFDNILKEFFDSITGRFLGIGANIGLDWGFPLLEKGWTGVYCEPDPIAFSSLIQNTEKYRNNVSLVNAAILPSDGLRPFYMSINSSFLSSLDPDWLEGALAYFNYEFDKNPKKIPILVNTVSFQKLIDYLGNDFDLIVIDTEGFDVEIAASIDWRQFEKCKMISLEHLHPNTSSHDIEKQLYEQGSFVLTDISPGHAIYRRD